MNARDRIEVGFAAWARFTYRQRWPLIVVMVGLALAMASQMVRLTIDNSAEAMLHPTDPTRQAYTDFRRQFGRDDQIVLAVRPPNVFDLAFLNKLRAFHDELEQAVPYLDEITSLVNARSTRGEGDELIVEDLMADWPEDAADVAVLRERVLANPLYVNTLISEDASFTTLALELLLYLPTEKIDADLAGFGDAQETGAEPEKISFFEVSDALEVVRELIQKYEGPGFQLFLAGAPCLNNRLDSALTRDMGVFTLLGIPVVMVVLYALFRRVSAVLLPLLVVLLSLTATMGLMGLAGQPLSTVSQILPVFLLVVGVCDSIHILVIFDQQIAQGQSRGDAIAFTLGHSGLAVLMTSLTTAGGLASFAAAELAPVAQLGIFAPIGVMVAFAYTVVLFPALLAVVPLGERGAGRERSTPQVLGRALRWFGHVSTRNPWKIVLGTTALLVLSVTGVTKLRFAHDALQWLPATEPLRIATKVIDRELRGSLPAELIVRSERENEMQRPARLNELEAIQRHAEAMTWDELFIGKAISVADIVKETHQALNQNDSRSYVIPQDRQLVAQELLLFETSGSDDLEKVVDSQFKMARITMKVPQGGATRFAAFLDELEADVRGMVGEGARIELTGLMTVLARTHSAVMISMGRSYLIALAVITPLMILLIGSFRRGILSMLPNLAPILLVLGLMGWIDVPLDMSTLMIGGVILGLAVDDTIHFMHNFTRYYAQTGDATQAVDRTLQTSGAAMLVTTLVLSSGFMIFTAGYLVNVSTFGALCTFAAVVAFLADVLLAPALMVLITRWEKRSA